MERAAGSGGIGATVLDQTEAMEGLGRFGWIEDPEGNRVELWEPAPEALVPEISMLMTALPVSGDVGVLNVKLVQAPT